MERVDCDVVVVGAGLAGLVAAQALVAGGREVVVLEARERVGGRLVNQDIGDGRIVEAGGQWIGPTQHRLAALAAQLGVETFPTYNEGEHLVEVGDRVRRYRGTIPRISPVALADFGQAQLRLDRMARTVPVEAPWQAPKAERWDAQTFSAWLRRNVRSPFAHALYETIAQGVWAAEPEELSLLHVLFYIRSAGDLDALIGTAGAAQDARFVGGSQRLATELAARLGARVRLGSAVRRIEYGPAGVTAVAEGVSVSAREAIVAIPPALAGRIDYEPPVPALRDQLTQRMPLGAVVKCHAVYSEPFWRQEGLSGQAGSVRGPAKLTFDNSPPDGSPGVLLCFLEGRFARDTAPGQRREAVVDELVRLFGPRAADPDAWYERSWADEPWTRGCYGGAMPPGVWTNFGRALRPPVGPIRWAGAEYALTWMGYMDGAVRTGEEQAAAILTGT